MQKRNHKTIPVPPGYAQKRFDILRLPFRTARKIYLKILEARPLSGKTRFSNRNRFVPGELTNPVKGFDGQLRLPQSLDEGVKAYADQVNLRKKILNLLRFKLSAQSYVRTS